MKPLFIPLKAEYFHLFATGKKTTEYRPYGQRWNERTCAVGRLVTLSRGYGKAYRLYGTVTAFEVSSEVPNTDLWRSIYGAGYLQAACITVAVIGTGA